MNEWISFAQHQSAGCRLGHNSFILSSSDARRWCNSMFSNNIRALQPSEGNRSAICDDRGRVQGLLDVYCLDPEHFLCVLDGVDQEWFLNRFKMYLILDDIELDDVQPELFHLCGPNTEFVLQSTGLPTPPQDQSVAQDDVHTVLRKNRFGPNGVDIITSDVNVLQERLQQAGAHLVPEQAFDALRILHGRARWPNDGSDKSMIHELQLNEECCAFDKGCYIGQEIINRIDVKGLINKKIQRLQITGEATLQDSLMLDGKIVGTLSSIAQLDDRTVGLSVLRKKAWTPGTRLSLASGGQATVE